MTRDTDPTAAPSTPVDTTPLAPSAAPGHYGPGYGDAAKHYGDDAALAGGTATAPLSSDVPSTGAAPQSPAGAAISSTGTLPHPSSSDPASTTAIGGSTSAQPDFTADEVTARPPTESPSADAPASENVGLTFERS